MQLLQLLLFFLYSDIDRVKIIPQYHYQIYKEVRYIKGAFDDDISINTSFENITITINDGVIDLNNYYPLDSLIISGGFDYLYFYQDDVICARVNKQGKYKYTIDDFILLDGLWYKIVLPYKIEQSKTTLFINKTFLN